MYYGSYYGGIEVRELEVAADGSLSADPASATPVTIPNRYEGAEVIHRELAPIPAHPAGHGASAAGREALAHIS